MCFGDPWKRLKPAEKVRRESCLTFKGVDVSDFVVDVSQNELKLLVFEVSTSH